jgi:hypothetical protein
MARARKFRLVDGVIVELVGDDALVMMPESYLLSLRGEAATLVRHIFLGRAVDSHHPVLSELLELGIVQTIEGVTRRELIKAGGIGAGAGIAFIALPGAAAASSVVREPLNGYFYPTSDEPTTWRFEISATRGVENPFPSPVPSTDRNDISELTLLSGGSFDWVNVGLVPDEDPGEEYVTWGDAVVEPLVGVQGNFSWRGSDGVTRYFQVTFGSIDL